MADSNGFEIERAVPYSLEAEQSVLGAMFLDFECIPDVLGIIKKEDFYIRKNQALFEAMTSLYNIGKPIDIVTLKEQLILLGTLETVGGIEYVIEVSNLVPSTQGVKHYAKIVEEKSVLRRLIKAADTISDNCYKSSDDVDVIVGNAEQAIIDISQERISGGLIHIKTYLNQSLDTLEQLSKNDEPVTGIPTGFTDIDRRTAGLHGSELVLIAARPGMGKTSFVLNIAQNVAVKSRIPVAIFSLEMPGIQIANRMLSSEAMVSSEKIKKGDLNDEDWPKIGEAIEKLGSAEIYIDDSSGITVSEIGAKCRKMKLEKGLGLVAIDYLQLMSGNRNDGNRQQEISEISRSLKILAKDLDVPVVALSQLSRATEKRENKEPILSDLRESGAIEQDADMVMFLYRDGYYNIDAQEPNKTKCIFAKHRNGEVGSDYLTWLGEYTKFSSWSGERER